MGSLSISIDRKSVLGDRHYRECTVTFSASYATGGDSFTVGDFGLTRLDDIRVEATDGTYLFVVDRTNNKIKVYSALTTEVAAATDLSGVSIKAWVMGVGA